MSQVWHPKSWLGDGTRSVGCIQSLADKFLIFFNSLTEVFELKNDFSNNFMQYLQFSMLQSDAYH